MAWELTGNSGTNPSANFLGTTDNQPLVIKTNGAEALHIAPSGNAGIGTVSPSARLSITAPGAPDLIGSAKSPVFLTSAGSLGTAAGSELALASLGFLSGNSSSLGVRALRTADGGAWPTTAIGLGMDVDNTVRAGASLWLHANGNVGVGTTTPVAKLDVQGGGIRWGNSVLSLDQGGCIELMGPGMSYIDFHFNGPSQDFNTRLINDADGQLTVNAQTFQVTGNVQVSGDIFLQNADCAEEFDIAGATPVEPGTVMALDADGALQPSRQAYDTRVAGVVSGAGEYQPGIVLDRQPGQGNRVPIALVGKVYCKVDAQYGAIAAGDLLTTSPTVGHAMKADDPQWTLGAVIGKALRAVQSGQSLIPVMVARQ